MPTRSVITCLFVIAIATACGGAASPPVSESVADAAPSARSEKIVSVKTVEQLNERFKELVDRHISLDAIVWEVLDERSLIIKSGGLFENKITLVAGPGVATREWSRLRRGTHLQISGIARQVAFENLRKELPHWEVYYMLVPEFLWAPGTWVIADRITIVSGSEKGGHSVGVQAEVADGSEN